MTPTARQELHDFCERARKRREREKEPGYPWTPADRTDAAVAIAVIVGAIVCALWGL